MKKWKNINEEEHNSTPLSSVHKKIGPLRQPNELRGISVEGSQILAKPKSISFREASIGTDRKREFWNMKILSDLSQG